MRLIDADELWEKMYRYSDNEGAKMPYDNDDSLILKDSACFLIENAPTIEQKPQWIPCSERLPEYGVAVLTYDGSCYCVEKRIPTIRDDNGEPISSEWWVSDDYDESNSEYYPNLRDGACIAWMPLPEPYREKYNERT